MEVEVCYALPTVATRIAVTLQPGATVEEAITASRIVALLSLDRGALGLAIFGRRATPDTLLEEGDRVELLRPLSVDPKDARRRRAEKRGGGGGGRGGNG